MDNILSKGILRGRPFGGVAILVDNVWPLESILCLNPSDSSLYVVYMPCQSSDNYEDVNVYMPCQSSDNYEDVMFTCHVSHLTTMKI